MCPAGEGHGAGAQALLAWLLFPVRLPKLLLPPPANCPNGNSIVGADTSEIPDQAIPFPLRDYLEALGHSGMAGSGYLGFVPCERNGDECGEHCPPLSNVTVAHPTRRAHS